jgi:hypothetical protein
VTSADTLCASASGVCHSDCRIEPGLCNADPGIQRVQALVQGRSTIVEILEGCFQLATHPRLVLPLGITALPECSFCFGNLLVGCGSLLLLTSTRRADHTVIGRCPTDRSRGCQLASVPGLHVHPFALSRSQAIRRCRVFLGASFANSSGICIRGGLSRSFLLDEQVDLRPCGIALRYYLLQVTINARSLSV